MEASGLRQPMMGSVGSQKKWVTITEARNGYTVFFAPEYETYVAQTAHTAAQIAEALLVGVAHGGALGNENPDY